jgi:pentatricopeptide repeat protein
MVNVKDIVYKYVVENHLFKDTHIELFYDDGEMIRVYADYQPLVDGLYRQGRMDLLEKVFKSMNEHFIKLRDSDREEERKFYPGKTAEEMFLGDK